MCPGSLASVRIRLLCQEFGAGRYIRGLRYEFLSHIYHSTSDRHQGNTLQCIKTFRELERLTIHCKLDYPPSDPGIRATPASGADMRTLQSMVGSVHSGSVLLSVTMFVWPSDEDSGWSYGVDRAGLLDHLRAGMRAILSRFTTLRRLHFVLRDNDGEYDTVWWTAEMVRRLPDSCHAAVSVEARLWTDGTSCGLSVAMLSHAYHAPCS